MAQPQKKRKRKIKRKTLWRLLRRSLRNPHQTPRTKAFTVGMAAFIAFSPFYGLQTVLGIIIAFALRLNKIIMIVLVNLITPHPVMPFIIFFSFKIGGWFMKNPAIIDTNTFFSWDLLKNNLFQYLTGGLLLATVMGFLLGIISYPVFVYQKKKKIK